MWAKLLFVDIDLVWMCSNDRWLKRNLSRKYWKSDVFVKNVNIQTNITLSPRILQRCGRRYNKFRYSTFARRKNFVFRLSGCREIIDTSLEGCPTCVTTSPTSLPTRFSNPIYIFSHQSTSIHIYPHRMWTDVQTCACHAQYCLLILI